MSEGARDVALRDVLESAEPAEVAWLTRAALTRAAAILADRLGLPRAALVEGRLQGAQDDDRASSKERRPEILHGAGAHDARLEAAVRAYVDAALPGGAPPSGAENLRCAHLIGELLNDLLAVGMQLEGAAPGSPSLRRRSGSFFTPPAVCASVVGEALGPLRERPALERAAPRPFRICDPAVGGGAFLLEACSVLEAQERAAGASPAEARRRAVLQVCGVDRSQLAVAVAETALWLYLADPDVSPAALRRHFVHGDALCGDAWTPTPWFTSPSEPPAPVPPAASLRLDWHAAFPEVAPEGFELVVGNPPWVAFAGRSAQPLTAEWRAYFRGRYAAFSGFPTLHGVFVQRAAELAPRGRVALLLPSAVADLDGYRAARATLERTHDVAAPLTELGQDVFEGVVQPTFVLIADGRGERSGEARANVPGEQTGERPSEPGGATAGTGAPWVLRERARSTIELTYAPPPEALEKLEGRAPLPEKTFRELGFQSNRQVTTRLFLRNAEPSPPFTLPLLEGRTVKEFRTEPPRVFLWDDPEELAAAGVRLRPGAEYAAVDFVVRQTAAVTIAARSPGLAFRNSLLAGYAVDTFDADLLVGLLNSSLFRALHLSRQRDARQAAFPQVKVGHLRRLPRPPEDPELRATVRRLSARATELRGCPSELRAALDGAVARLFGLDEGELDAVRRFLAERVGGPGRVDGEEPAESGASVEASRTAAESGSTEADAPQRETLEG